MTDGLPQLTQISSFPSQIFWLIVTFGLLYYLMSKVALPRVAEVLDERDKKINDNLAEAEELRNKAEAAKADYEAALEKARRDAHGSIVRVSDELTRDAEQRHAALAEKLKAQISAAEADIAAAKDQAMGEMRTIATEVAATITQQVGGVQVEEAVLAKHVDSLMQEKAE